MKNIEEYSETVQTFDAFDNVVCNLETEDIIPLICMYLVEQVYTYEQDIETVFALLTEMSNHRRKWEIKRLSKQIEMLKALNEKYKEKNT
jgi:ABC-type Na+ transport system ATPase subunit NatA